MQYDCLSFSYSCSIGYRLAFYLAYAYQIYFYPSAFEQIDSIPCAHADHARNKITHQVSAF